MVLMVSLTFFPRDGHCFSVRLCCVISELGFVTSVNTLPGLHHLEGALTGVHLWPVE